MAIKPTMKIFFFKLHSSTLPVASWLAEKGVFVPWSRNCRSCKVPETIDHVFIDCWDPVFHWDILQRTIKKELPITPHGIRFLPVRNDEGVPYDMLMVVSLHSIWKTRMAVRENFIESVVYLRDVYRTQAEPPELLPVLDELASLKKF